MGDVESVGAITAETFAGVTPAAAGAAAVAAASDLSHPLLHGGQQQHRTEELMSGNAHGARFKSLRRAAVLAGCLLAACALVATQVQLQISNATHAHTDARGHGYDCGPAHADCRTRCRRCAGGANGGSRSSLDVGEAAVASDEGRCSAIGRDILEAGGNAVDAAVAVVLCAGVLNPVASGLGGGAFLLIRMANGTSEFIDCRETAPKWASENMFEGREANVSSGALSIAVPGELKGLHMAWQRHGVMPWADLISPSAKLASDGFEVSPYLAAFIQMSAAVILGDPGLRSVFAPQGKLLSAGDVCYRKQLAATLAAVADQGPDALYHGKLARSLTAEIAGWGGIVTEEDLAEYEVAMHTPVTSDVFGLQAIGAPPSSSGGAAVLEMLKVLEGFELPLASAGPLGVHRTVEAMKHAFAMRAELGDPRYVDVAPVLRDMLSTDYAARLRQSIQDNATFPPSHYGRAAGGGGPAALYTQAENHGTSHTCVVDRHRNVVSVTSTINGPWGAGLLSPSTGIVLNNEMADFSLPPSEPRPSFAPPPAPANFIRPGKRPLSSMSPMVLLQDGQLRAVVGGSGGTFIISAVVQVVINYFLKGMSPLAAVSAPRVHHQLLPNILFYENNHTLIHGQPVSLDNETLAALERRGHQTMSLPFAGVAQLIVQDLEEPVGRTDNGLFMGMLTAVSDPRKDGVPAGY